MLSSAINPASYLSVIRATCKQTPVFTPGQSVDTAFVTVQFLYVGQSLSPGWREANRLTLQRTYACTQTKRVYGAKLATRDA